MAYLENKIGEHRFVLLDGTPIPPRDRVSIDDRDGVSGLEFTLQGIKGEPFQMVSSVDTDTYAEAQDLPSAYATLCGSDLVELVHNGKNFTSLGWKVKVLAVRPPPGGIRRISGGIGNKISTNSQGWCVCVWDLVAVDTEEEA